MSEIEIFITGWCGHTARYIVEENDGTAFCALCYIGYIESQRDEARQWAGKLLRERNALRKKIEEYRAFLAPIESAWGPEDDIEWGAMMAAGGICLKCGGQTQQVRPGKYQCPRCEQETFLKGE